MLKYMLSGILPSAINQDCILEKHRYRAEMGEFMICLLNLM